MLPGVQFRDKIHHSGSTAGKKGIRLNHGHLAGAPAGHPGLICTSN